MLCGKVSNQIRKTKTATNGAGDMDKCGKHLEIFYPNLIHVTSLVTPSVAEVIRGVHPEGSRRPGGNDRARRFIRFALYRLVVVLFKISRKIYLF